ncbi:urokinase plasminogen activator surface receptor-like [Pelobates fuscus]|uniref:urokinase plasminogen activator surface receptor-like n=1 Tax=Pelobates fuscus TaxID=191477 RepID=UPI002FE44989
MSRYLALLFLCVFLSKGSCLKCNQCSGIPYNCIDKEQQCFVNQTSCISQSFTIVENGTVTEKTFKGCSEGLVCNETMYLDRGIRKTYMSSSCCLTDNCNTGTYYSTVPVAALNCLACIGNNQSCTLPNVTSIRCAGVQDRCMTITSLFVSGSSSNSVVKACGTGNLCDRRLEYNTGKGRLYTDITCCGKTNCNNGAIAVSVNETLNGLQCYACNETGKGECTKNITKVQCTGNMTSCMDIQGFPRGTTLMRGCCSKDVCLGLSTSLFVLQSQKLYCCKGNLCNNGVVASYFSSSLVTAEWNVYLLGMALLVVIGREILL